jgi:hypothetical protein
MHRNARALAVGATAAAVYLAGSRLRQAVPVRPSALAAVALVGMAAQVFGSKPCAKAAEVEQRINDMLANGYTVNGNVTHTARVDITSGNLHMHGNNINLEGGTVTP